LLRRAEVRDVLAWMRLLVDPQDAAAVVRALARPPIELRQAHLARVIALARRRSLDLVAGCEAAIESPQVPPEARERIERFLALHRSAAAALLDSGAEAFIDGVIESLGTRGRALLAPAQAARRQAGLERLQGLALDFVRAEPTASAAELARHLAKIALEAQPEQPESEPVASSVAPDDPLREAYLLLREEVLDGVARIGGQLSELRLDTELDVSHGIVRYLELVKLAALMQREPGRDLDEAIADINARLLAAVTSVQREIFLTSSLDEVLTGAGTEVSAKRAPSGPPGAAGPGEGEPAGAILSPLALARPEQHSLLPFLPRRGSGLALSASDVQTYRSCPLRYKFARVLRIPTEQTLAQRFGIVVHQVLERYHAANAQTLAEMLDLFEAGWRRSGLGDSEAELVLHQKGHAALRSYHARLERERATPVWFERSFSFRLGPHHMRGRVDRVDRVADAGGEVYELIDYKTSRAKTPEQLTDDIQLSLYALAAREDWRLNSPRQAYYYVLDDRKVAVPSSARGADAVKETVIEVGEGILAQRFDPTPSHAVCSMCDYRIVCPAAER
jgi:RecB family exonuclease